MPTTDRSPDRGERGRVGLVVTMVVLLAIGAGVGLLVRHGAGPLPAPPGCTAKVGDTEVSLSPEQARNAALIAAIGVRRGLPARAVSIALATAFQESKLVNIDYGDRDSLGLFQQRPSQGWGTEEQVMDPVYAANAFYDELVGIDGYQDMRITEAAQAVQRSGFPEAYEQHADGARALASALTGWSPAAFTCVAESAEGPRQPETASGLTPRAERVRDALTKAFGPLSLGGFSPGGVDSGHMAGSAHYDGRAVDVLVRPVNEVNNRKGWAIAHYLVAHASTLEIQHVIFDDRIWSSGRRSEAGWRDYRSPRDDGGDPARRAILEHRDHVHVDVVEGDR